MRKLSLLFCLLLATLAWTQQTKDKPIPNPHHAAGQTNNRGAAEPQVGYAAQTKAENSLLGCVRRSDGDFLLVQEQEKRTYRLRGTEGKLASYVDKLVQITGSIVASAGGQQSTPSFQVKRVQVIESNCGYQPPSGIKPQAMSGKTGNQGAALPVTDTSTAGHVTPGAETQAGQAQAPGKGADSTPPGVPQQSNQTAAQGAPATPEQAAQNPVDASRIADKARQIEMTTQREPATEAQAGNAAQKQQPSRRRESKTEQTNTASTLIGCLTGSGDHFVLREQKTGAQYRLKGSTEKMKDHANHLVHIVVRPAQGQPAVASGEASVFHVTALQDLAPTCGARRSGDLN